MASNTNIEWTDVTWNPTTGCTKVSDGCKNCYAERRSKRLKAMGVEKYRNDFKLTVHEDTLEDPLHWRKPRRVFVNSMSDLFHEDVPFEFIDKVFAVMALCPQHTFQVLTKRPERMAEYLGHTSGASNVRVRILAQARLTRKPSWFRCPEAHGWPYKNVWLGTSCEDQATADERIPHLLQCPAAVRFLSLEPLLGPLNLDYALGHEASMHYAGICPEGLRAKYPGHVKQSQYNETSYIDWVIVGGESGPGARPCNLDHIRHIISQCRAAGVPCFVKQLGSKPYDPSWHGDGTPEGSAMQLVSSKGGNPDEWPTGLRVREMPESPSHVIRRDVLDV